MSGAARLLHRVERINDEKASATESQKTILYENVKTANVATRAALDLVSSEDGIQWLLVTLRHRVVAYYVTAAAQCSLYEIRIYLVRGLEIQK